MMAKMRDTNWLKVTLLKCVYEKLCRGFESHFLYVYINQVNLYLVKYYKI